MENIFMMHPFILNVRAARISARNERSRVRPTSNRHLARRRRVTSIILQSFTYESQTPWITTFLVVDEDAVMDLRFSFLALVFLASRGHGSWIFGDRGAGAADGITMRRLIDFAYGPFESLFEQVDLDDGFWD